MALFLLSAFSNSRLRFVGNQELFFSASLSHSAARRVVILLNRRALDAHSQGL